MGKKEIKNRGGPHKWLGDVTHLSISMMKARKKQCQKANPLPLPATVALLMPHVS
ncbi:uncharacterized protein G2W53_024816 [Senna tora]|uniref:Uncharacterized protein n=1 Tax=Senna tora TaxID=362788 RepID=A0A834TDU5_9FABA|nr:uncharacterized protein G2W53_024816 [Senna tora]